MEAANGGVDCTGNAHQGNDCNTQACPTDCEWSEWTSWTDCPVSCGGGKSSRRRNMTAEAANGGKKCVGDGSEEEDCKTQTCPVDCKWSNWGRWSECTKTCGNGKMTRLRSVSVQKDFGGKPCDGLPQDTKACDSSPCPGVCEWSEWGEWTKCTQTCGGGTRSRTRPKKSQAHDGGADCEGKGTMQEECSAKACPTDCKWMQWGDWYACPVSCGSGWRSRVRVKQEAHDGGKDCTGEGKESSECTNPSQLSCPGEPRSPWLGRPAVSTTSSTASTLAPISTPKPVVVAAAANMSGTQCLAGDLMLKVHNPAAFVKNQQDKNAISDALAQLANLANSDGVIEVKLSSEQVLVALDRGEYSFVVDARYTIDVPKAGGANASIIAANLTQMKPPAVSFAIAEAMLKHHLNDTAEAASLTAKAVECAVSGSPGTPAPGGAENATAENATPAEGLEPGRSSAPRISTCACGLPRVIAAATLALAPMARTSWG
mmetsp:Transcript_25160/g.72526  ORF Transcript_25160/g.72526 Transcript_25160/m.72526 type:complete len:487 (+) Transcript_25160:3-1463(+)